MWFVGFRLAFCLHGRLGHSTFLVYCLYSTVLHSLAADGIFHCAFVLHKLLGGHLYLWLAPLLAPDSTVGKPRLVVVAVQGAPPM